ncbi:dTDP-rhamnosyl transferase rfbF [Granulibacter bethesdensis]|uniref:dTDP-rhamnosyl transferase rfbF n=1 Tax=Granulibacter bethesdensis TaxID=364410 RepID=A0AAN0RBY0_9PROT|nr:glycosyltransferase [Granulibacter bethesdensis]AHJ61946.1 dTDP-rhamnosyl transferase rfbF [Granulibacter bethesdensis]
MAALGSAAVAAERQRLREYWRQLAEDAYKLGERAMEQSQWHEAAFWLARATRLSPRQDTIRLLSALLKLRRGDPTARADFESLARQYETTEILSGLATLQVLGGDLTHATVTVQRLLSRIRHDVWPIAHELLMTVSRAAGLPGWCRLSADGHVHAYEVGTGDVNPASLSFTLDGITLETAPSMQKLVAGHFLDVRSGNRPLLGSPFDLVAMYRVQGWIDWNEDGDVQGWAWHPGCPDADPLLSVISADGHLYGPFTAHEPAEKVGLDTPFARPRRIHVLAGEWDGTGLISVRDVRGNDLLGSPLDPRLSPLLKLKRQGATGGEGFARAIRSVRALARALPVSEPAIPCPADILPAMKPLVPLRCLPVAESLSTASPVETGQPVSIVMPVYGGGDVVRACLESVLATVPESTEIIIVDDAGYDPVLLVHLQALAGQGRINLLHQARNRGFPSSVNLGMRAAGAGRDVVLLNSDTLVPEGWLERLQKAACAATNIGTATPFSNDASILSYPQEDGRWPLPDRAETEQFARFARQANKDRVIDIPVAVGFCMYIRRDCLGEVGVFRDDVFAQGYGEENDFCLRARALGWRHVVATGAFVAHVGGGSFGEGRSRLAARNESILSALHPGYHGMVAAWRARNPLHASRRAMDGLRFRAALPDRPSVLMITHDRGGGVQRQIETRMALFHQAGRNVVILRPVMIEETASYEGWTVLDTGFADQYPHLRHRMPHDRTALLRLLRQIKVERVELHHLLGHDHAVAGLAAALGVPQDMHVHDYAAFCPRIALMSPARRYCGEPEIDQCERCIAEGGSHLEESISVAALRHRSQRDLMEAAQVVTPSQDVARRMRRHFPALRPIIVPWEEGADVVSMPPGMESDMAAWGPLADHICVICVIGAIGAEKGFDCLLEAARDAAARSLPLRFVLVGHSVDDPALLETGYVRITGRYSDDDLPALIVAQKAKMAWIPSIWPETWCFTLSEAWRAGLSVVAFDLGTVAERIKKAQVHQSHAGFVMPLGMPVEIINDTFLSRNMDRTGFAPSANRVNRIQFC